MKNRTATISLLLLGLIMVGSPAALAQIQSDGYTCGGAVSVTHNLSTEVTKRQAVCVLPHSIGQYVDLSAVPELSGAPVLLSCLDFSIYCTESLGETFWIRVWQDLTPLDGRPSLGSLVLLGEQSFTMSPAACGLSQNPEPPRIDGDQSISFDPPVEIPTDARILIEVEAPGDGTVRFGANDAGEVGDPNGSEQSWVRFPNCSGGGGATPEWQTSAEFVPGYDIPMVSHYEFPSLAKILTAGPDPVAIAKEQATTFAWEICVEAGFDGSHRVIDTIPAEFDGVSTAGCGTHRFIVPQHPNGRPRPLEPERLEWELAGCDDTQDQCLLVTVATDENPGNRRARRDPIWEPTSCGPLVLNEGASLVDAQGAPVDGPSNVLIVATCDAHVDPGCEDSEDDADLDRWTASCGDCDDSDARQYPGAPLFCDRWNPDEGLSDDDCDGTLDFPTLGDACDNGEQCLREGVIVCNLDGTGTRCNAPINVPPSPYGEECQNDVDDDCDGDVDEAECCSLPGGSCTTDADCCCGTPELPGCGGVVLQTCGPDNLCRIGGN